MTKKTVEIYLDDGSSLDVDFPAHWVVCGDCRGKGTMYLGLTSREQPAWTSSEWYEEGFDFHEDYFDGNYDKPCPTCAGRTTVFEIDEPIKDSGLWAHWVMLQKQLACLAELEAMERAERRMGA